MRIPILSAGILIILALVSCKKDQMATGTDKELFDMAVSGTGFTWYKNSSSLLNRSSASGHSQPFLRTRYNSVAAARLDQAGKVINGTVFPEGSLIVKELWESSTSLERYAILYKQSTHPDSDDKGWVWGYINSDGTVAESASKKGSSCSSCHSQSGNIDNILMNIYFP